MSHANSRRYVDFLPAAAREAPRGGVAGSRGGDRFDREAFKAHLIAMAQDAKTAAASGTEGVQAMLASLGRSAYRDGDGSI